MGVGKEGSIAAAESLQMMADKKLLKASVTGDIAKESYTGGDSAWFITGPWNVNDAVEGHPGHRGLPGPQRSVHLLSRSSASRRSSSPPRRRTP